nr:hypothetical protein BgiMline_024970 [Biomphalaria glabrata]
MPLETFAVKESNSSSCPGTPTKNSSSAMAQAMNVAMSSVPSRISCRVRNAGREYLQHNETCQWIQFMTEDTPDLSDRKRLRPGSGRNNHIFGEAKPDPKEEVYNHEAALLEAKPIESPVKTAEVTVSEAQLNVSLDTVLICCEKPKPTPEISVSMPAVPEPPKQVPQPQIPNIDEYQHSVKHLVKSRRLKGCVANTCALRDEGTIGSLIWQTDMTKHPLHKSPPYLYRRIQHMGDNEELINSTQNQCKEHHDVSRDNDWSDEVSVLERSP